MERSDAVVPESSLCRVAAVQWERRVFASCADLRASLEASLSEVARAGAALVAFPDGAGEALRELLALRPEGGLWGPFRCLGSSLARTYGVTLGLGPVLEGGPDGPQRVAPLFGPTGELLGTQVQTHRNAAERALGLVRGNELVPIATPLGLVGLVSGTDVEYPEVSRILCLQGAAILVHHGALPQWSDSLALSRLWREIQANQVFGVEAYGVGRGAYGRSAIHAPLEMVPDRSGWLARAPDAGRPAIVCADLDWAGLRQVVGAYPIHALRNLSQYRRYFPRLYERWVDAGGGDGGGG